MNLIALCPCRNESWVLGLSMRVALKWADSVVILDHASTDSTPTIIDGLQAEFPGRVHRLREEDSAWNEASIRQRMLDEARRLGATHMALVDADEILSTNLLPTIRDTISALAPGECLRLPWPALWRDLHQYRVDDSPFGHARVVCAFRDDPGLSHNRPEYPIHTRIPNGARIVDRLNVGDGGIMHLQFLEWGRLVAKQSLYRISETILYGRTPAEIEKTYSAATDETGLVTAPMPAEWWAGYEPLLPHLRLGETPWQAAECERLIAEHGREKFAGLNLSVMLPTDKAP